MNSFRDHLMVLKQLFRGLSPDNQANGLSLLRDTIIELQSTLKENMANNAMRTVAAMAETMIQETYGLVPSDNGEMTRVSCLWSNDGLSSPPYLPTIDTNYDDVLTNVLYESLQTAEQPHLNNHLLLSSTVPRLTNNVQTTISHPSSVPEVNGFVAQNVMPSPLVTSHGTNDSVSMDTSIEEAIVLTPVASIQQTVQKTPEPRISRPFHCCKWCDVKFLSKRRLYCHLKLHFPYHFVCVLCSKRLNSKKKYSTHLTVKHKRGVFNFPAKTTIGRYACKDCNYVANHRQNLHRHKKIHENTENGGQFWCNLCKKSFKRKWSLKEHNSYIHSLKKPFVCQFCNKQFSLQKDLNRHKKLIHLLERLFCCNICDKTFKTSSHLKRHERNVHKNGL